jgi:O-glycosyl hydrolase
VARVGDTPVAAPGDAPALARLRMQMPRSLHDAAFEEPTWIVDDWLEEPIRLLPRLNALVRAHYPGTELAITEWAYGGATRPSGAVAVADALGAMGRHGVAVATYWPLTDQAHDYARAAFRMYRGPAAGVAFGDRSVAATSNDPARVGAWASLDGDRPERVAVVLIGRADEAVPVRLTVEGAASRTGRRFVLDEAAARPREVEGLAVRDGRAALTLPARSVTTLVLDRTAD